MLLIVLQFGPHCNPASLRVPFHARNGLSSRKEAGSCAELGASSFGNCEKCVKESGDDREKWPRGPYAGSHVRELINPQCAMSTRGIELR